MLLFSAIPTELPQRWNPKKPTHDVRGLLG